MKKKILSIFWSISLIFFGTGVISYAAQFKVQPDHDWVMGESWTPGATISLTIDDGGGVPYTDSQTADAGGNFNFGLGGVFDVQRGHVVTVSDGADTKTHTVANLYLDSVDVAADKVHGRADAGISVNVWVHEHGNLTVEADVSGNWTADFSGTTDLTYLSNIGANQTEDGDQTDVHWSPPQFRVQPDHDWVMGGSWTPGATISLTIDDGGGVPYTDSQTADAGGNFNFGLGGVFDVQRGHVVTVSDGADTKTHTVANLYLDSVDVAADKVHGRADAGISVNVWVHEHGNLTVEADVSGNWTADFSGTTDLTYLSNIGANQTDEDGDQTDVHWSPPQFRVQPDHDWVMGGSWTPGATISLTIDDGGGVPYTDLQTADAGGNFNFGLGDVFDVQRGHVVTVSDGADTKTHTVANLYLDSVDVAADKVHGRADAGTSVNVWVHEHGNLTVEADVSGNWTADFSGATDLTYASNIGANQTDEDGDQTDVHWSPPQFKVQPDHDWVMGGSWTPGATISLTIDDGGGVPYTDSQTADAGGNFNFGLGGVFDVQRGHVVTVSDGADTKTHTVANLYLDSVDVAADKVHGRADAGISVNVWVHEHGNLTVEADVSGNWTADFSGATDLTYLSNIGANQTEDGDQTDVHWSPPQFRVQPDHDWVMGGSWTPGATISLTIDDGGGVPYTDLQTADAGGNFNFGLGDVFDVQRGHVVTVSDGADTKTHTVANLYLDSVDVAADKVHGRADADTSVNVWVHEHGNLIATADGSGNWAADFSGATDLTYLSNIGANQTDEDGDQTDVHWSPPQFKVQPDHDWVMGGSWTPGATISLTIDDGGGVPYTDLQTADAGGNFNFGLGDVFDVQRGHVVTVSDGADTKTHTVANLYLDSVDVAADKVHGRADADTSVNVWVHEHGNLIATADGSGNWAADFSGATDLTYASNIGANQTDEDGDQTDVHWSPPQFKVQPDHDWVMGGSWTPGATISLTIDDGGGVPYTDLQTADAGGNFNFGLGDVFDVQRGHVVTVSDGADTKTHTVADLFLDHVDVAANTVSGRADAGISVNVWVHEHGNLTVEADVSGNWTADFSGTTDLTYLSNIGANQTDTEGDTTEVHWSPSNDSDGDGLSDDDEIYLHGTDPNSPDTDGDGLSDGDEILYGTNPNNNDTDGDKMSDGWEVYRGTNPNNITESPEIPIDFAIMRVRQHNETELDLDTYIEVIIQNWELELVGWFQPFTGTIPDDIDSITIVGATSGEIAKYNYPIEDSDWEYYPQWKDFFISLDGSPNIDTYTATITTFGGLTGTSTDTQTINRTLPLFDTTLLSPASGGILDPNNLQFYLPPLSPGPSIPLYYRLEINYPSGGRIYADGFPLTQDNNRTLPDEFLPEGYYRWRPRAYDNPDWKPSDNRVNGPWTYFWVGDDDDTDKVVDFIDNCPGINNPNQDDSDNDEVGDVCDICPNDPNNDEDGDGICGDVDNCPGINNPNQDDADNDEIGDACDICPNDPNNDVDGDGLCGDVDNCPEMANPDQSDLDGDELGDVCDEYAMGEYEEDKPEPVANLDPPENPSGYEEGEPIILRSTVTFKPINGEPTDYVRPDPYNVIPRLEDCEGNEIIPDQILCGPPCSLPGDLSTVTQEESFTTEIELTQWFTNLKAGCYTVTVDYVNFCKDLDPVPDYDKIWLGQETFDSQSFTVGDQCSDLEGDAGGTGCPLAVKNTVMLHTVILGKGPSTKEPVPAGSAAVRVFDRNSPAFQDVAGSKNPKGALYGKIFEADQGRVGTCVTDSEGICFAGETQLRDYLVILRFIDLDPQGDQTISPKTVYVGSPLSPDDFDEDGIGEKKFQIIKVFKNGVFYEYRGGSKIKW